MDEPIFILSISFVNLNSSIGIKPSLFNPKSINTNFFPILLMVPVDISPSLNFLPSRSLESSFSNSLRELL